MLIKDVIRLMVSKVVNYVNLVVNSTFTSTSGWTAQNSTISAVNNTLSVTGTGNYNYVRAHRDLGKKFVTGNKVFGKVFFVRVTNAVCQDIRLIIKDGTSGTEYTKTLYNPIANQWYDISDIFTITGDMANNARMFIDHHYADNATATGKVMELKQAMAVDMVASGIADKDVAWCNANLPFKE